jgi:hypothetical protein
MKEYALPPIIINWIENLHDQKLPLHIRDNYARMMSNVSDACITEVAKFRLVQNSVVSKHYQRKKGVSDV